MQQPTSDAKPHRCGYVAIVGRPNVGKSSLLNQLLGQKVAIVTPKPQTTRHRILGILSSREDQIIFIDTPGMHLARNIINKRMVQVTQSALAETDVILFMIDAIDGVTPADRLIAKEIAELNKPTCIVLNKIDKKGKSNMIPLLTQLATDFPGIEVVPISARNGDNFPEMMRVVHALLPEGPPIYDSETYTDQTERILVQEAVREQVLLQTKHEVPYSIAVSIDRFEEKGDLVVISATINVERPSQKGILVGSGGTKIRDIGKGARLELEKILGRRVYLELFVRVTNDWTKDQRLLDEFGL